MKKSSTFFLAAIAISGIGAMSASAQVIYNTTYDTGNASGYSQNDTGAPVVSTFSYQPGTNSNGVGGSTALSLGFDASAVIPANNYAVNMFSNQNKTGNNATSADLSLFTLNFDVSALGLVSNPQTLLVDIKFAGGANSNGNVFSVTGTGFDSISINLGAAQAFGTAPTTANINNSLQLKFYTFDNAANKFGRDGGNAIYIDNVTLTAVPEPSTVALLGLGAAGMVIFARRRSRRA